MNDAFLEKLVVRLGADAKQYNQCFADAVATLDGFVRRVERQTARLAASLTAQAKVVGASVAKQVASAEVSATKIASAAQSVSQPIQQMQADIARTGAMLERLAEKSAAASRNVAAERSALGLRMLGSITLPAAATGAISATQYATFENQLVRIGAAGNLATGEIARLEQAAMSLSDQLGLSPDKILASTGALTRGGMSLDRIIGGGAGRAAVQLAEVGELQSGFAAETLSKILNVFARDGMNAAEAANTLSAAADASLINIHDVAIAAQQGAGAASAAGQSFREFAASVAMLGKAGQTGSDAGTSLRSFFSRLVDPSAADAMRKFGISATDAAGNIKALRDTIASLEKAFRGLPTGQKLAGLTEVFGQDAMRVASAFVSQGTGGFDAMTRSMDNALSVNEKYLKQLNTLKGSFGEFTASLERLAITLGKHLAGPIKLVTGFVSTLTGVFENLRPSVQQFISLTGVVAAATGPVLLLTGTMGQMLGPTGRMAEGARMLGTVVSGAFNIIRTAVGLAGSAIGKLALGVVSLLPRFAQLNALILAADFKSLAASVRNVGLALVRWVVAHPIIAVASAVGLAAAAFLDWGKIVGGVGKGIKGELDDVQQMLRDFQIHLPGPDIKLTQIESQLRKNKLEQADAQAAEADARARLKDLESKPRQWSILGSLSLQSEIKAARLEGEKLAAQEQTLVAALADARKEMQALRDETRRLAGDKPVAMTSQDIGYWEHKANLALARIGGRTAGFIGDEDVRGELARRNAVARGQREAALANMTLGEREIRRFENMTSNLLARLEKDFLLPDQKLAEEENRRAAEDVKALSRLPDAMVEKTQEFNNAMLRATSPQTQKDQMQKRAVKAQEESLKVLRGIDNNLKNAAVLADANVG